MTREASPKCCCQSVHFPGERAQFDCLFGGE